MSTHKRVIFIDDQTRQLAETSVRKPDGQPTIRDLLQHITRKVSSAGGGRVEPLYAVWLSDAWEVYQLYALEPIRRFPNEEAAGMFMLHRAARNG